MPKTKTTFTLVRADGERKGKVDVWQADSRIGPAEQFEFRKLGDGSVAIYHNDTLLGDIDDRSKELIDWKMESDGDDDTNESPTNIRTRQHAAKIKEQHLTEAFRPGMSIATVARQFGYSLAEDGTFMRWTDVGIDRIKVLGDGRWQQQSAGVLQPTTGSSPQELWDHLDFIDTPAETHTGPQLSKYLNRTLFPKVENLSEPLAAAVLEYAVENKCSDFSEILRAVTKANPGLWEKHKAKQVVQLID